MHSGIHLTSKKNIQRILYADGQNLIRNSEDNLQQDIQCTYNVTLRRVRVTNVSRGKSINITCPECVSVALVILHALRMCHIVICGFYGCAKIVHIIS
jgi:hypothetical protein